MKITTFALALAAVAWSGTAMAAPLCEGSKMGFAGVLAKCNRGEPVHLKLVSGQPLYEGKQPVELQSGAYYEIHIEADGSAELAVTGPQFFRSVWLNEVVINDIEVRPMAVDSFEFDAAGKLRLSFVAIRPGSYDLYIPGSSGDTQKVTFAIR